MTIKQLGGVFGRNPTFNDVTIDGELILNGEIFTGLDFQGSWNASTNTPTLASGVGTTGEFYIVSVAGTTNLDGITNWGVGDWAMFSGSAWQRVEGNADGNFVNLSVSNEATFPDNAKAIFGTGSDLQIYHDGGNSRILETGAGFLAIGTNGTDIRLTGNNFSEYMAKFDQDGAATLYYDNSAKIATSSSGISVTGTATMDGLQVTNTATTGTDQEVASFRTASGGGLVIRSSDLSAANPDSILEPFFGESLKIKTSGNDRFKVADNGDISFYDDAAAQGLFWDSSASALGIGTTTPSGALHVKDSSEFIVNVAGSDSSTEFKSALGNSWRIGNDSSLNAFAITQSANLATDVRLFIANGGSVGIGTDLPAAKLHIENGDMRIEKDTKATIGFRGHTTGSTALAFRDSSAAIDRMTIDASGNLLVGTTSQISSGKISVAGGASANGITATTSATAGFAAASFQRTASDGDLIGFKQGATSVGSIGVVNSDNLRIGGVVADHAGLQFGTNILIPETAGTASDGLVDIGTSANRYKNLYLSTGVVFGATGGDVTSKTLDDYEEGAWTPVMRFAGGSTGITYALQDGQYTKVGRLVTAYIRISLTNNGTDTGLCDITLPFAVGDVMTSTAVQGTSPVGFVTNFSGSYYSLNAHPWEGTSTVRLYQRTSVSGDSDIQVTESEISNTFDCRITVQYMTA